MTKKKRKIDCTGLLLFAPEHFLDLSDSVCGEASMTTQGSAQSQLTLQPFPPALSVPGVAEFCGAQYSIHGLAQSH